MTTSLLRRVRRGDDRGFTLVELLVVMILLSVIGAIFTGGMMSGMRADRRTRDRVNVTADLAKGVDRITKQVRVAAPVIAFSPTSLSVETYRNGKRYRYTYTYDAAAATVSEKRDVYNTASAVTPASTSTSTLLRNVTNGASVPLFTYYDRDGVVATTIAKIARVQLTLVETPYQQGPIRFQTSVFLRNFRET